MFPLDGSLDGLKRYWLAGDSVKRRPNFGSLRLAQLDFEQIRKSRPLSLLAAQDERQVNAAPVGHGSGRKLLDIPPAIVYQAQKQPTGAA